MPIEVTAITHKKKPVFAQIISQVTPSESSVIKKVAYEPMFLAHLKTGLGVKGIRRVFMHERLTNLRPVIFLQFAAGTPRTEVWRGLQGASTLQSNCGKIVVAVSEDIDPSSMDAVLWSMAYRCNPVDDMQIVPNRGGVQGAQYAGNKLDSGLLVDATRKRAMPPLALPTKPYMEHARALVGRARPWSAQRAGAVAWLHAGRLDRHLGDLRQADHRRRLGGNRPRDIEAPAPRAAAGNAGAAGTRAERRLSQGDRNGPRSLSRSIRSAARAQGRAGASDRAQSRHGQQPERGAGDGRPRQIHPPRQQARPAAPRNGDPPGRLARQLALRVVAPRPSRP